jgi:NADPH:quinone reductase-like Zn-dependent oxidoreductase
MTSSPTNDTAATNASSPTTTSTMKAIQVHKFVTDFTRIDEKNMTMSNDAALPTVQKDEILVRVLACSISPGDDLMVRGNMIFLHPKEFPFVPGMDVCGEVVDPNGSEFQTGDIVVASNGLSAIGGMAEYMSVSKAEAVLKPPTVSVVQAAACSSAITARNAVLDHVQPNQRVLILGGSGGVGSSAITLAKHHAKASFVATTSTQTELCTTLGADVVINYRTENWWEHNWGNDKFDVIIDTIGGGNFTEKADKVLKSGKEGGKFVAVTGDDTKPDCTTWWKAIQFFAQIPLKPLYSWWYKKQVPRYIPLFPYSIPQGRKQVLQMMQDNSLRIVLDERSPLPFNEDGVRQAFQIVASGHAHGKVVVSME